MSGATRAPGIDGMTVKELGAYLQDHWPGIRFRLLDGTYEPQLVRRVEIPKVPAGFACSASRRCLTALSSRR